MYKRRIKAFLILIAVGLAAVMVRLGHLQILRGQDYRQQAEKLLVHTRLLTAGRGRITDRTGERVLAVDKPCFDFCLDYRLLIGDRRWICTQIARAEGVSLDEAEDVCEDRVRNTWHLAEHLAAKHDVDVAEAVERIKARVQHIRQIVGMKVRLQEQAHPIVRGLDEGDRVSLAGTVGAEMRRSHRRWYPYGELACHVIGLTGQVSAEDQQRLNRTDDQADWQTRLRENYLGGDAIGKRGLERLCERLLRARRGFRRLRRSNSGFEVVQERPAQPGTDVHLTLDVRLQEHLTHTREWKGHKGCAVVLSVPRGEVLALVSRPTFDLNRYSQEYRKLAADTAGRPLIHRAVAARYPPGSTVKPLVALAGLASGAITARTVYDCHGPMNPNEPNQFRCWIYKSHGAHHGPLDLIAGLKHSCNIYFYSAAEAVGPRRLVEWFTHFGFADVPGTGLASEVPGKLPTEPNRRFYVSDCWLMGVGQGPVVVTPLHVANAMATIARDGEFRSPVLVLEGGPPQVRRKLPLTAEHLATVRRGLWKVVNEPGGTAYKHFRDKHLGVQLCGKTGTAQELSRPGDMVWFAGFAPHRHPSIAFAVVVEHVEGGPGPNAVPLAVEVVRICQKLGYCPKSDV